MKDNQIKSSENIIDIFNGSIALTGICLFIVSLFHISNKRGEYIVDEFFCISSGLLFLSMIFAFLFISIQKIHFFKKSAEILFWLSLSAIIVSSAVLWLEL